MSAVPESTAVCRSVPYAPTGEPAAVWYWTVMFGYFFSNSALIFLMASFAGGFTQLMIRNVVVPDAPALDAPVATKPTPAIPNAADTTAAVLRLRIRFTVFEHFMS